MQQSIGENQVAFVTGGASGIGKAVAEALRATGARVIVADVHMAIPTDVTIPAQIQAALKPVDRLHIAVNCAGIEGVREDTSRYPIDAWDRVLAVNLTGVFHCMQAELARMLPFSDGVIVNISSVAGVVGFARHSAYSASKHGVIGLTRSAALEYARSGIRINAVCPGFTRTPMMERALERRPELEEKLRRAVPAAEFATPEQIAATVLHLCSEGARHITGQAIVIDGGLTAS